MKKISTYISRKYGAYLMFLLAFLIISGCQPDRRGLTVGKIKKASKLATTEFTIDKIVYGTKTKRIAWIIKLNEARFLAYSQAIIKTGIDLNKLTKADVDIDGSSIQIKLPPVEIINFSYPPKLFRLDSLITDDAFLNKISIEDQEKFFMEAELDIRNNLQYIGIVETTQDKTRILLEGILKSLGYTEIHLIFSNNLLLEEIPFENEM